jgi:hypothetical protein
MQQSLLLQLTLTPMITADKGYVHAADMACTGLLAGAASILQQLL